MQLKRTLYVNTTTAMTPTRLINQDGGAGMSLPGDGAEVVVAPKRHSEEGRGGFVLRAKSDEVPHRRRSLVERTGMKNFVQVRQQRHSTFFVVLACR